MSPSLALNYAFGGLQAQPYRVVNVLILVLCALGNALGRRENLDQAISHFREAVHISPDFAVTR